MEAKNSRPPPSLSSPASAHLFPHPPSPPHVVWIPPSVSPHTHWRVKCATPHFKRASISTVSIVYDWTTVTHSTSRSPKFTSINNLPSVSKTGQRCTGSPIGLLNMLSKAVWECECACGSRGTRDEAIGAQCQRLLTDVSTSSCVY